MFLNSQNVVDLCLCIKRRLRKIPVWVSFHEVLMAAFTNDGLSIIASKLDTPMLFDSHTTTMYEES